MTYTEFGKFPIRNNNHKNSKYVEFQPRKEYLRISGDFEANTPEYKENLIKFFNWFQSDICNNQLVYLCIPTQKICNINLK